MRWTVAAVILTLVAAPAAAEFDAGKAAYDRKEYAIALPQLTAAAEQGDARAQYLLGAMYLKGEGVALDHVQAFKWFDIAATSGDNDGAAIRNLMAKVITPAQVVKGRKLAEQWRAKHPMKASSPPPQPVVTDKTPTVTPLGGKPRIEYTRDSKDTIQSGRPAEGQPGRPAEGQPGRPAEGQPGRPAEGQPGRPAKGQPGRPAGVQPSRWAGRGGFVLQLGAFQKRASAVVARDLILRRAPDLSTEIVIVGARVKGRGSVYRLRTGLIAAKTTANSLCKKLQARSIDCFAISVPGPKTPP